MARRPARDAAPRAPARQPRRRRRRRPAPAARRRRGRRRTPCSPRRVPPAPPSSSSTTTRPPCSPASPTCAPAACWTATRVSDPDAGPWRRGRALCDTCGGVLDTPTSRVSTGAYPAAARRRPAAHRRARRRPPRSARWGLALPPRAAQRARGRAAPACRSACTALHARSSSAAAGRPSDASAIEMHERHIAAAAELGARCYVVHPDLQRRRGRGARGGSVARALVRGATPPPGGVRAARRRREHAVHRTLALPAPDDLDLEGLRSRPRRRPRRDRRDACRLASDPRATLRTCTCTPTTAPRGRPAPGARDGGGRRRAGVAAARVAGASIVLEHIHEADVVSSLEHLKTRGLLPSSCDSRADSHLQAMAPQADPTEHLKEKARFLSRSRALQGAGAGRSRAGRGDDRRTRRRRRRGRAGRGRRPGHELYVVRDGTLELVAQGGRRRHHLERRGVRPPDAAHGSGAGVHDARARRLDLYCIPGDVALDILSRPEGVQFVAANLRERLIQAARTMRALPDVRTRPVTSLVRSAPVFCDPDTPIREAAAGSWRRAARPSSCGLATGSASSPTSTSATRSWSVASRATRR